MIVFNPLEIVASKLHTEMDSEIQAIQNNLACLWERNELIMPKGSEDCESIMAILMSLDVLRFKLVDLKWSSTICNN